MVHSVGCSVRNPTHDGRTLGVDRPSSRVVGCGEARRGPFRQVQPIPAAPDVFLIGSACGSLSISISCEDFDEAFALCSLCLCLRLAVERPDAYLAAIARTYA